ncbi:bacteriophage holin [Natrarchaeobius sp. A-rgal3]|uniref:bacteriophage holin n=1 Tax=Natrarchaeobius versutus TaxID=1679078 RepID=UPI00350F9112
MRSRSQMRETASAVVSTAERNERLDPIALGFAVGIVMATSVGLIGVTSRFGWGERWRTLFAGLYPGFEEEAGGTVAGIAWGGVDGFVAGLTVGSFYNRFRCE